MEYLVVGAGITGCVIAERIAQMGNKVLVIDKREHIGGNCYDEYKDGVLVPKYGPHLFHTNDEEVWAYVNRFSQWTPYEHRVLSSVDGKLVPVPVNVTTVNLLTNNNFNEVEMEEWLSRQIIKISEPKNSEDSALSRVGVFLYQKLFKNYTLKQWGIPPIELDASVMNRIPVRINFDDRYFTDKYQAMPRMGYTEMFNKMLNRPNINVVLGVNHLKYDLSKFKKVFFTGPIDEYHGHKLGHLQYRSLMFEYETHLVPYYQNVCQVNYPNEFAYTRITEPKHATRQAIEHTVIIKEYPTWGNEPYYPVPTERNRELYKKYTELPSDNVHFVGRLGQYKYMNMDQAFRNALDYIGGVTL